MNKKNYLGLKTHHRCISTFVPLVFDSPPHSLLVLFPFHGKLPGGGVGASAVIVVLV